MTTEQFIKKLEKEIEDVWIKERILFKQLHLLNKKVDKAYKRLRKKYPLIVVPDKKYWNNQIYSECQLITLWNAYIYYGIKTPKRYGKIYKRICKQSGCTYGACLDISKIKKKFKFKEGEFTYEWISSNLPTEITIYPPCSSRHSVLIIDAKDNMFLITNYLSDDKLYWVNFKTLQTHNTCKLPQRIIYKV